MGVTEATYISSHNPADVRTWSGTALSLLKVLKACVDEVDIISGLKPKHSNALKTRYKISQLFNKGFYYDLTSSYGKQYAKLIEESLSVSTQLIFTHNSHLLPYLKKGVPTILYSDATFKNLEGYYTYFSDLLLLDKMECQLNDKKAMQRADALIFSSEWAAQSAIKDYHIHPGKITVSPFGPNLPVLPDGVMFEELLEKKLLEQTLHLLWMGVDYERKGAEIAIEIAKQLHNSGIKVELSIVGVSNKLSYDNLAYIKFHGQLNKNIPEDLVKITELFEKAHLFILPTLFDCSPIVLSEAAAMGLPVVSSAIAGIPDIVINGLTGYLISNKSAIVEQYLLAINKLRQDKELYIAMSRAARKRYETFLNWGRVQRDMVKTIDKFNL